MQAPGFFSGVRLRRELYGEARCLDDALVVFRADQVSLSGLRLTLASSRDRRRMQPGALVEFACGPGVVGRLIAGMSARVAWRLRNECGLKFERTLPFTEAELAEILTGVCEPRALPGTGSRTAP